MDLLIIEVENTNGSGKQVLLFRKNELFTFKSISLSTYLKARKYTGSRSQRVRLQLPYYRQQKKLRGCDFLSRVCLSVRLPVRGGMGGGRGPYLTSTWTCSNLFTWGSPPSRSRSPYFHCIGTPRPFPNLFSWTSPHRETPTHPFD